MSSEEKKWYEIARNRRLATENYASMSWTEALRPRSQLEFVGNSRQFSIVKEWFNGWRKRLEAKKMEVKNPDKRKLIDIFLGV